MGLWDAQRCDEEARKGRALLFGAALALCLGLTAAALSPSGARGGIFAELDPVKRHLTQVRERLIHAEEARRRPVQIDLLNEAEERKGMARAALLGGQNLLGCGSSTLDVLESLEQVDLELEVAAKEKKDPEERITKAANRYAGLNILWFEGCTADTSHLFAMGEVVRDLESRAKADEKLTPAELKKAAASVEDIKQQAFAGERLYECEAFTFYSLVKKIDVNIELARTAKKEREETLDEVAKRRKKLIKRALDATEKLIDVWKLVPCGGSSPQPPTDPPPGGDFPPGGDPPPGGETPPPSGPACGNGADDDADGAIDFPGDFGCFDGQDIGEKDMTFPVMCPDTAIGPTRTAVDFNFGAGTPNGYHLRDTSGGTVIHQSTTLNHPPVEANGNDYCPGSDTFLVAGIGNQAPMCGGCPAVDDQTLRILVDNLPAPGAVASTKQGQAGVGTR